MLLQKQAISLQCCCHLLVVFVNFTATLVQSWKCSWIMSCIFMQHIILLLEKKNIFQLIHDPIQSKSQQNAYTHIIAKCHVIQSCPSSRITWGFFFCKVVLSAFQQFVLYQRAHPRSDQEENELVMASLRHLYEERQRCHQHVAAGDHKQVTQHMHSFDHVSLPT